MPRIIQLIGVIRGGLLFGLFAEAFGCELANLRLGLVKFRLQLVVSLDGVCVPALPIAHLATQLADLPPQLRILRSQLSNFRPQLRYALQQGLNLNRDRYRFYEQNIHDACNKAKKLPSR